MVWWFHTRQAETFYVVYFRSFVQLLIRLNLTLILCSYWDQTLYITFMKLTHKLYLNTVEWKVVMNQILRFRVHNCKTLSSYSVYSAHRNYIQSLGKDGRRKIMWFDGRLKENEYFQASWYTKIWMSCCLSIIYILKLFYALDKKCI